MFAITIVNRPGTSSGSAVKAQSTPLTPFSAAPCRAASSATASLSVATTRRAPSFFASNATTPLPVPTSSRSDPGSSLSSSSQRSRQSAVVGWLPVPNAMPGSIATATPVPGGSSHGGCTQARGPTCIVRWCARHSAFQSSSGISTGGSAPSALADSLAALRSAKCAIARPRPSGRGGVPGIRGIPGSCSSTPRAPRSNRSAARISSCSGGATSTSAQLTGRAPAGPRPPGRRARSPRAKASAGSAPWPARPRR